VDENWQTEADETARAADARQPAADADGQTPLASTDAQGADEPTPLAASAVPAEREQAPTVDEVMDALSNVIDPELGLDFVELGLIYGVEVQAGDVHVTFTLTTPGCPIGPMVTEQIEEFVGELDGVRNVSSEMVFTPPWSPEKMSEDAKFALGF
jgi:metal-sulfur cluster biosynthetic enzyme